MKMFLTNLDECEFYASDVVNAKGEMIRIRIPPLTTAEVVNIDPYFLNQDKNLRNAVFRDGRVSVSFQGEDDDLIPLTSRGYDDGTLLGAFLGYNFTGAGVSVAPNATDPQILDVTIPGGGAGSGKLLQTQYAELAADANTTATSPVFSTLLSVPITVVSGALLIRTSFSADADKKATSVFRVLIDGAVQRGASMLIGKDEQQTGAIILLRSVAVGLRTVTLEWAQLAGGATLSIAAGTLPGEQHASLEVQEATVP